MNESRGDFWVDLQWHGDPEPEPSSGPEPQKKPEPEALKKEDIEKMIQSATDRVRTEYSQKLKEVEAEKEELQKQSMSEKQRAEFELEQQRKKNAETAAELAQRELALERVSIITELSIPRDLADFVQGKDRNDILSNAKNLMKSFETAVLQGINKRLAQDGEDPQSSDETPRGGKVDWQKIWAMPPGPEKDTAIEEAFAKEGGGLNM